jgi:hypothetical protein
VPTGKSSVAVGNEFIASMIKKSDANFLYQNIGAVAFFAMKMARSAVVPPDDFNRASAVDGRRICDLGSAWGVDRPGRAVSLPT